MNAREVRPSLRASMLAGTVALFTVAEAAQRVFSKGAK